MLVYGSPQFEADGAAFVASLRGRVAALRRSRIRSGMSGVAGPACLDALRALLAAAGQLEQAIHDALEHPALAESAHGNAAALRRRAQAVTDAAAEAFVAALSGSGPARRHGGRRAASPVSALERLDRALAALQRFAGLPRLVVRIPEGFAFYALYPEQYVAAAEQWLRAQSGGRHGGREPVAVLGIPSIGTSLSAVVAATLRAAGWPVLRGTVRPGGQPFAREVAPEAVRAALPEAFGAGDEGESPRSASCPAGTPPAWGLVVDEGPGLSGSSMAATARALRAALNLGPERIALLPGHAGEPGPMASEEVRALWATTPRHVAPPEPPIALRLAAHSVALLRGRRTIAVEELSGGRWRALLFGEGAEAEARWPAVCAAFERPKFRCTVETEEGVRSILWVYAGFCAVPSPELAEAPGGGGAAFVPATEALAARQAAAAAGRWSVPALGTALGFVALPWVEGCPLAPPDATPTVVAALGRYLAECAGRELAPPERRAAVDRLRAMAEANLREALGEAAAKTAARLGRAALRELLLEPAPVAARRAAGDGRMAPREWLRTPDGRLLKPDAGGRAFDHTLIGHQPLLWDVAAVLVEWELVGDFGRAPGPPADGMADAVAAFLATAECAPDPSPAAGGGAAQDVLPAALAFYTLAYAAFRMGQCAFCADLPATHPAEAARLRRDAARYRRAAEALLRAADGRPHTPTPLPTPARSAATPAAGATPRSSPAASPPADGPPERR